MRLKRFVAPDTTRAMRKIKETLGDDALILSSQAVANGVEIVAAVDYDESVIKQQAEDDSSPDMLPPIEESRPTMPSSYQRTESSPSDIDDLKKEVGVIKELLENQLSGFAWQSVTQYEPMQILLLKRLHSLGFDLNLCAPWVKKVTERKDHRKAWVSLMSLLLSELGLSDKELIEQDGIYAFVGPTGVGKTTTLAKIAARFCLRHGREHLGLITMDNYRIAAHEQLITYGKILGVSVSVVDNRDSLITTLNTLKDKRCILIDTAGANPDDERVKEMLTLLEEPHHHIQKILVVSATSQSQVIDNVFHSFGRTKLDHCILTKIDEATNIRALLSVLLIHKIPIAYLTDGQRVPENIAHATRTKMLQALVNKAPRSSIKDGHSHLVSELDGGNS